MTPMDFAAYGLPPPPDKFPETTEEKRAALKTLVKVLGMPDSYISAPMKIGVFTDDDAETHAGAMRMVERGKTLITELFVSQGEIPLLSFIFSRTDFETGAPARNVYAIYLQNEPTVRRKDLLSMVMKSLAYFSDAAASIFASEAWMVDTNKEGAEDLFNRQTLADHPERTENIITITEHKSLEGGATLSSCRIFRHNTGNRTLGPWETRAGDTQEGRFVGTIQHPPEN